MEDAFLMMTTTKKKNNLQCMCSFKQCCLSVQFLVP